jgi:hypothetical protein
MTTVTGWAEIAGGRLFYGLSGNGRPLVLIHAMTLDHRCFDPQMEAIVAIGSVVGGWKFSQTC